MIYLSYSQPGNVRELRNFCKFIMINEKKINNNVIKKHLQHKTNQFRFKNHNNGKYIQIQNLKESVASFWKGLSLHYLSLNNWKISQTAKSIGLERTNLHKTKPSELIILIWRTKSCRKTWLKNPFPNNNSNFCLVGPLLWFLEQKSVVNFICSSN